MVKKFVLPLAVGLFVIVGCSSPSAKQAAPAATAEAAPSSDSPSIDCETASQADWQKYCASLEPQDEDSQTEAGSEEQEPIAGLGESFDYSPVPGDESTPPSFEVTLTKMDCGLKSIRGAESNPDWNGGDDHPKYVAAKPAKGKDFCIFYWTWKNVGKVPGTTDFSGDVMIGDERHSRSPEDEMMSWTVMDTQLGVGYTDDINPKESTKSLDIYQVPARSTPTAIWFPGDTMMSPSYLLISTK